MNAKWVQNGNAHVTSNIKRQFRRVFFFFFNWPVYKKHVHLDKIVHNSSINTPIMAAVYPRELQMDTHL